MLSLVCPFLEMTLVPETGEGILPIRHFIYRNHEILSFTFLWLFS